MADDKKQHSWLIDVDTLGASYEGYLTSGERSDLEWEVRWDEPGCYVLSEPELEKFLTRIKQAIENRNKGKALERSAA